MKTGSWTKWFEQIPTWALVLIATMLISWFIAIFILRRLKTIQENDYIGIYSGKSNYPWGYIDRGEVQHAGVIWKVREPAPNPIQSFKSYQEELSSIDPELIEIDGPPRCPRCKTKLEERQRFWVGYSWSCVSCDFSKKNKDSFYKEADQAKKRAEASLEKRFRIASEEDH